MELDCTILPMKPRCQDDEDGEESQPSTRPKVPLNACVDIVDRTSGHFPVFY